MEMKHNLNIRHQFVCWQEISYYDNNMKIVIVTSTFPPYAGGIGNVAAANARQLVKLGHEVTVLTPLYRPVKEEITDLKVIRLKPFLNMAIRPWCRL
jgi:glycosyltransferase involved in cell wall biosynthesis